MSVSFSFFYFQLKYKIIFQKVAASWWNIIFAMNVKSLNYYEHYGKKPASAEASTVSLDVAGQVPSYVRTE